MDPSGDSELEARLTSIEAQLDRLAHELEPAHGDASVDERLARLREQVEGLKAAADRRLARSPVSSAPTERPVVDPTPAAEPELARPVRAPEPRYSERTAPRPPRAGAPPEAGGFWELLGPSPQARYGFVLIGVGSIAVVYAVLSVIRF